jgi:uncharacterized NAD-dependent epimerase/dehydratase family protein
MSTSIQSVTLGTVIESGVPAAPEIESRIVRAPPLSRPTRETAIVYCEANFGLIDGKTANGLVRQSELYEILSVIDSMKAGQDSGLVLGGEPNSIPIFGNLAEALSHAGEVPEFFIFGMAPSSGMLSRHERDLIIEAMRLGMNIVNGLHEYLNDDPELLSAATLHGVSMLDVRKPRAKKDLRMFSGRIADVDCPRIAVLGTDCAIGKRTTATILTHALCAQGIKAVMVGTGQTGLIQGARYGVPLDAVPSQFCAGELEATIIEAYEAESPDIIIIEGQGALSHPAFSTSAFILRGSAPQGVILQHAPARIHRCDFPAMPMPDPTDEIHLIQTFSDTKVIGMTINHEDMADADINKAVSAFQDALGIPVTDALSRPPERLVAMITDAFPELGPLTRVRVQ